MISASQHSRSKISREPPTQLYVEVTNLCNSHCKSCPHTYDQFVPYEPKRHLSYDDFCHIVDQIPHLERAVLHGIGEPLLNKDLPRFVTYLKRRGTRVLFNTNAILLDQERGDALTAAGLDELHVSLDAVTPTLYAQLRGIDRLPQVIHNLNEFITRHGGMNNPTVSLWWVAMQTNLWQLPNFVRLAAQIGIHEIHLQRLVFFGDGEAIGTGTTMREDQSLYSVLEQQQINLIDECETLAASLGLVFHASGNTTPSESVSAKGAHPWQACMRPWTLMYITANGNALPCCISPFATREYSQIILGNVFQQSIHEVWNDPPYQRLRSALLSDAPAPWPCQFCGVRWSL